MSDSSDWRYDYLQPENAKYFSNPRAELRPEDYAPSYHPLDDYDNGDWDPPDDDEEDDDE